MKQGNSLGDSLVRKYIEAGEEDHSPWWRGKVTRRDAENNVECLKKKIIKGEREIGSQRMSQHKELDVSQEKL